MKSKSSGNASSKMASFVEGKKASPVKQPKSLTPKPPKLKKK